MFFFLYYLFDNEVLYPFGMAMLNGPDFLRRRRYPCRIQFGNKQSLLGFVHFLILSDDIGESIAIHEAMAFNALNVHFDVCIEVVNNCHGASPVLVGAVFGDVNSGG